MRSRRGITLVEVMVAVAFFSTIAVAGSLAYIKTMQALTVSKTRGIASRLAQDKFETLRGLSYTSLMVTTQEDLDVDPPAVDQTYYPPETIDMAGKTFTRETVVSRAYRDGSGNVTILSPSAADTGLKQITINIKYSQAGETETRTYTSLVSDPGLVALDGLLYGSVTSTAGLALANARVFVTQNQNWAGVTSSTGYYEIEMDTKAYTVTSSCPGYWDKVSATVTLTGPFQQNFQLQARLVGRIHGLATYRPNRLLISGVLAGSSSDPNEHFLELYNPTTYSMQITDGVSAKFQIQFINSGNSVSGAAFSWGGNAARAIPSEGYFLVATSSPTVNGIVPDAVFSAPTSPFSDLTKAGVALQDAFGVVHDSVGWTNDNGNPGPSLGVETRGVYTGGSNWGSGGFIVRYSSPTGVTSGVGSSYDSGDNSLNLELKTSVDAGYPRSSSSTVAKAAFGAPASSATMIATDGYSAASFASSTGYYVLSSVTTGTWSVGGYYSSYSSVTAGVVDVGTASLRRLDLLLEPSDSGRGGISGQVLRSDTLVPVGQIAISAGTSDTITDAAGNYILSLSSGSYTVIANSGYADIRYNSLSSATLASAGAVTTGVNFNLVPSGVVTGKITTNGVDPYPSFPVHVVYYGAEVATAITDVLGNYALYGVPTGINTVSPILDAQSQSATPTDRSVTVTQGTTHSGNNFTATSSLARITGSVSSGSNPIATGVLVVASTAALADLPTLNSSYRSGVNVLYSIVTDTAGNYTLQVVKNSTYTVYAYYPSLMGTTGTTTASQSQSNVYVTTTSRVDFQW